MRRKPPPAAAPETPTAVLGDLLKAKGFAATPEPPAKADDAGFALAKSTKIVVRREKKGRGGKTVTVVSGVELPVAKLELLARALRKGLGCGSTLEGAAIVLQGDITDRARAWLEAHGAKKVVVGN